MSALRCPNSSVASSAKLFVQLSLRHSQVPSRQVTAAPILDILLPSVRRTHHTSALAVRHSRRYKQQIVGHWVAQAERKFTTSLPRQRTQAIYNPQVDEDGKEMLLEITPRAAKVCIFLHLRLPASSLNRVTSNLVSLPSLLPSLNAAFSYCLPLMA
jgi:hypothetical protein